MPYSSEKQRAYMHAKLPELAKKWDEKYGGKIDHKKKLIKAQAERMRKE